MFIQVQVRTKSLLVQVNSTDTVSEIIGKVAVSHSELTDEDELDVDHIVLLHDERRLGFNAVLSDLMGAIKPVDGVYCFSVEKIQRKRKRVDDGEEPKPKRLAVQVRASDGVRMFFVNALYKPMYDIEDLQGQLRGLSPNLFDRATLLEAQDQTSNALIQYELGKIVNIVDKATLDQTLPDTTALYMNQDRSVLSPTFV